VTDARRLLKFPEGDIGASRSKSPNGKARPATDPSFLLRTFGGGSQKREAAGTDALCEALIDCLGGLHDDEIVAVKRIVDFLGAYVSESKRKKRCTNP